MTWVTFDDMRKAGYCARGTRAAFEQAGIDINKVIQDRGIASDTLREKFGEHAMVELVIKVAEDREAHG